MKAKADLIVTNARVYTSEVVAQPELKVREASSFAVKDGRFIEVGAQLTDKYDGEVVDLKEACVLPGLIDPHCHFLHFGRGLEWANLKQATSVHQMLDRVATKARVTPVGKWVRGRGWKESEWSIPLLPTLDQLDSAFPDHPVYLVRIDGHAALVNSLALKIAGIETPGEIPGGRIGGENKPDGLLVDAAMELVRRHFPEETSADHSRALLNAQEVCFSVGLTSVHDAGLSKSHYELIHSLHREGNLRMPIYGMLTPDEETVAHYRAKGPFLSDKLKLRSFKYYADGALGSRGARLIDDYSDDQGNKGIWMHDPAYLRQEAALNAQQGFQMCTHAIGDAANRLMLDVYEQALTEHSLLGTDHRWRIEHAQLVQPGDQHRFGTLGVLPSIQATHATSDMGWVEERLGAERLNRIGYPYHTLLEATKQFTAHGCLPGGSDFPIEDVNPLYGFHAATARQDQMGSPADGFLSDEGLTRTEALLSMTSWAAMAGFEEAERGSIAEGKRADFVVLDRDIMHCPLNEIPAVKIQETWMSGKREYKA